VFLPKPAKVVGKWDGFEEIRNSLKESKNIREKGGDLRDVPI